MSKLFFVSPASWKYYYKLTGRYGLTFLLPETSAWKFDRGSWLTYVGIKQHTYIFFIGENRSLWNDCSLERERVPQLMLARRKKLRERSQHETFFSLLLSCTPVQWGFDLGKNYGLLSTVGENLGCNHAIYNIW
jgi:hypothetical protein